MPVESNKAIVCQFIVEVFNQRNILLVNELVSPDFVNHNASIHVRGPEGVKRGLTAQFQAFSDIHTTIEDIIAEGDKVVVRGRDPFTQQADGKPVELTWIEILRLENGKLAEAWVEADMRYLDRVASEYK
jgi:predicted SnoaL-like aldol condensation-catalyzing enzyme